jgi:hypothetical protein
MYLIESFSRLQQGGRDDTVSVYMPSVNEEQLSDDAKEGIAMFMRMAATFAKQAIVANKAEFLEHGCRVLNRAMEDCSRG